MQWLLGAQSKMPGSTQGLQRIANGNALCRAKDLPEVRSLIPVLLSKRNGLLPEQLLDIFPREVLDDGFIGRNQLTHQG